MFYTTDLYIWNRDSSLIVVTTVVRFPTGIFLFATAFKLGVGPTELLSTGYVELLGGREKLSIYRHLC